MKKSLASKLAANVDDWYANRITFEEFGARNRALWDEVKTAGPRIESATLRVLRSRDRRIGWPLS